MNDAHGHPAGDICCIQQNGEPGRMDVLAQRTIQAMAAPVDLGGAPMPISTSIGVVTHPDCGDYEETLIQRADSAMYAAKKKGGSRAVIWRPATSVAR